MHQVRRSRSQRQEERLDYALHRKEEKKEVEKGKGKKDENMHS